MAYIGNQGTIRSIIHPNIQERKEDSGQAVRVNTWMVPALQCINEGTAALAEAFGV